MGSADKSKKSSTNTKSVPKSIHDSGNSAIAPSATMVCVVYVFNYLEFWYCQKVKTCIIYLWTKHLTNIFSIDI